MYLSQTVIENLEEARENTADAGFTASPAPQAKPGSTTRSNVCSTSRKRVSQKSVAHLERE